MPPSPDDILHRVFGFSGFRPGQEEIAQAVIDGRNVLAIMPTGGGKSLCYQLPALCRDGLTVVISPLIALMRDQVRALQEAGVAAAALTSGNSSEENDAIFSALDEGRLKLLYIAPERLAASATTALLRRSGCALIAVDEAHCVSQWGHDFRPDYLRIGALRRALGVPLAAFTATADGATRDEIAARLFEDATPVTFLRGFDRPNIRLAFAVKNSPRRQILTFAEARRGQSGIVYCATRARTESLARALDEAGFAVRAYHGGMEDWERRKVEDMFQRDEGLVVCATVAFGMGVDKPDVRWVLHADLPKSVEAYYQEIGRAGRDGLPAETLTLYGPDDIRLRRAQIDESPAPLERREADHARLNTLLGLAETAHCRRRMLLAYFGEVSEPCGNCDMCAAPARLFNATEPVRKALSAMLRTGEWFGTGHLIDILTGNATDKVRARGHDQLPTFSVGRDLPRAGWQAVFRQMMGRDLVRPDPERHGALRMTEAARPILRGEEEVHLREDTVANAPARAEPRALVADEDAPLLAALKAHRRQLAETARVPPYVIFNDRSLIEMAERRPRKLDDFARINGVGATKLERYGTSFLEVITNAPVDRPNPARRKLSGTQAAPLYDRLLAAEQRLARGPCGTLKPMSLSAAQRARIAAQRPSDTAMLARLVGERAAERFGDAFLEVLNSDPEAEGSPPASLAPDRP
ncbi:MAG: ATP-dependent DNA helicase RecQ [Rhodobacteraceae bacterium HLUCCA12]|nr:MAG: ATP-dependent DNA helicase RecQ [Rhodobacteraceae bacterium HLUCCA12]